jgi:transcriptional regulator with XRE-family HTH domain
MVSQEVNIFALRPYPGIVNNQGASTLDFPQQLAALRKHHGLTQQALAERVGIHVVQLRRYEGGTSQPTLDVIRRLATALSVSADLLLFGRDERGPDQDLRLQFEAVSRFDADEKQVVRSLLEGMILKHEARRWSSGNGGANNGERK